MDLDLEMDSELTGMSLRLDTKISGFLGIEELKLCFCYFSDYFSLKIGLNWKKNKSETESEEKLKNFGVSKTMGWFWGGALVPKR